MNVQEQQIEDAYDYSFSHMSTDISAFPVEVWTKLVKRVFENYDHELSSIPQIKGPIELRQSIAKLVSYQEVSNVIRNIVVMDQALIYC